MCLDIDPYVWIPTHVFVYDRGPDIKPPVLTLYDILHLYQDNYRYKPIEFSVFPFFQDHLGNETLVSSTNCMIKYSITFG